ncbi:MAG: hypothetical protein KC502_09035 [Myxococcales bacterium]|nr:hypothetical protein [Myxococcales bacterium]
MEVPSWLGDIELVTFDCFGTLLDWRRGLASVEIEEDRDFAEFVDACAKIQGQERHVPYTKVLKDTIRALRPKLRPAVIGLFADDLGRVPAFPDSAGAVGSLKDMVQVGVLSNCDANHQLDVISSLRVAWDVCITSQEIRNYKPSDRAWDAIVRMGVARTAATRDSWLHVSAFDKMDLIPARGRGLRTCHLLRQGGDEKATADLVIESLDELVEMMMEAKQGPLLFEVRNEAADEATREELRGWLVGEMMPSMREAGGMRDARLVELDDGALIERYTFGGKSDVATYEETFAAGHRAMVRERFDNRVTRTTAQARVRGHA